MRSLHPLMIASLLAAGFATAAAALERAEPKPVPDTVFEAMDGSATSLADFAGRTVVLNFWATWCAPCKREMPSLDRLQAAFDTDEVIVLALAADRAGPEKLRAWLDEIGIENLHIYRDPKLALVQAMGVPGLPVTVIIDADGNEIARHAGFAEWDSPETTAFIEEVAADNR